MSTTIVPAAGSRPYQASPTPFPRPDHKAKRHGRPVDKKHVRRTDRRAQVLAMAGEEG